MPLSRELRKLRITPLDLKVGMGVVPVTVWQSLAQIQVAYGRAAGTVLTNSVTKAIFSGTADPEIRAYIDPSYGRS